ncbi:MAG: hypothetical protein HKO81_06615 [Flavobacteriaceae bacterium]|nr:hypothetical protein [Flavobacteriaceae bacterium]
MKKSKQPLFILFLLILLINWSCSKEITSDSISTINAKEKGIPKSEIISSNQIPGIIDFIEQETNGSLEFQIENTDSNYRNHEEDLVISSVLTDQIKQVTNGQGKSSYTFELIQEGDKSGIYFMNLIVKEYADELYLFIMKYVPDEDWLKGYKTSHDFASFSGMIYYYDSEGRYLGKGTMINGSSISTEHRNPCPPQDDPSNPDNDGTDVPSGGGGTTESEMPSGENSTGGGLYWIVVTVYHTIPSGETFEFGAGSVCQHPGECIVTVVVEFIYQEQDRSMRDLVDCPPPTDCFDVNGDPCANGCDEEGNCIEDVSEVESTQTGILIDNDLQRLANQLNELVGEDSYEFFIPSSDEETINFDSFEDFENYLDELNEFQLIEEEFIEDGQLRTDNYRFEIDPVLNTDLFVSIFTEQAEPNSDECMEVLNVVSTLIGNTMYMSWSQYEDYDIIHLLEDDIFRIEFQGVLTIGVNIDGFPFKTSHVYSFRIDYSYSTGELLVGWPMSVD